MQAMVPLCAAAWPVRIDENTAGRVREERMIMSENGIVQHDGRGGSWKKKLFFQLTLVYFRQRSILCNNSGIQREKDKDKKREKWGK